MPHWFEDALLALDLETTGLDPIEDRIVQAAVVLVGADGAVSDKSWDGIVDPGVPIPVGASNIHGITTERARQEGMPPVEALQIIARLVDNAADRGMPLVIFNAPFDWPFVLAEAQRHGVQIGTPDIVDPLVIDRAVDRYRKGIVRLTLRPAQCRDEHSPAPLPSASLSARNHQPCRLALPQILHELPGC